jgi:hypothetical protein
VRDSGIAKEIQVSTNGSRIDSTPLEVFSEIDSLNISWYPDARCGSQKIELAREICRRAGTKLAVRKITEFRKMETGRISNERLVDSIYRTCEIAHAYYAQTFYDGRFYLCSRPIFSKNYFDKIGVSAPDFREIDGIPLHAPDLKERLFEALGSTRATAACGYCLGTVGKKVPWRPLQAHERKAPALAPADPLTRINRRRLWFLRLRRIASLDHYLLFMPLFLLFMGRLPMPRSLGRLRKTRSRLAAQPQLGRLATGVRRRS